MQMNTMDHQTEIYSVDPGMIELNVSYNDEKKTKTFIYIVQNLNDENNINEKSFFFANFPPPDDL